MERNLPSSKREQEDLTSSNQCDYSRTWYRSVLSVLTRQSSNVSNRCGVGNPKPWVYSIVPFWSMGDSSETRNLQKDSRVMEALRDPTVSVLARAIWFSLVKGLVSMIHANPMTR